jgi:tetratricopeptide (TPR) repeat protein
VNTLSRGTTWLLTLLTMGSIAASQAMWDNASAGYHADVKLAAVKLAEPALPSLNTLKALSLNQGPVIADLLWLQTIQYFGQGNPYGKYPSLGSILNTITQLDPKFEYPYEFGMIVLPFMDQTPAAVNLGERAQTAIPNNGLLTFYLASVYHLNVKDFKRAGDLYSKASTQPGAPGAAQELAGVAYAAKSDSLGDRQVALAFWKAAFDNAKDDGGRDIAARWYAHMQIVYSLEVAAQSYKAAQGSYPQNIQDLKDAGYISVYPVSPINRLLILNPETGRIDFSKVKN